MLFNFRQGPRMVLRDSFVIIAWGHSLCQLLFHFISAILALFNAILML